MFDCYFDMENMTAGSFENESCCAAFSFILLVMDTVIAVSIFVALFAALSLGKLLGQVILVLAILVLITLIILRKENFIRSKPATYQQAVY